MEKNNKILVADVESGEILTLNKIKITKKSINKKLRFVKLFYPFLDLLPTLTKNEIVILTEILKNLKPNSKIISFEKNKKSSAFYKTIATLQKKYIITKVNNNIFEINENYFFNGCYY